MGLSKIVLALALLSNVVVESSISSVTVYCDGFSPWEDVQVACTVFFQNSMKVCVLIISMFTSFVQN